MSTSLQLMETRCRNCTNFYRECGSRCSRRCAGRWRGGLGCWCEFDRHGWHVRIGTNSCRVTAARDRKTIPATPGTFGRYRDLVALSKKNQSMTNAHHIGQYRAFCSANDTNGDLGNHGDPFAVLLNMAQHKAANAAQRTAYRFGDYGIERSVAYDAMRSAGYSPAESAFGVALMDVYYLNELGLKINTPTYKPANRR